MVNLTIKSSSHAFNLQALKYGYDDLDFLLYIIPCKHGTNYTIHNNFHEWIGWMDDAKYL